MERWVRVEVLSLGDFQTIRRLEVVAGHDVVDVVDASGSHPDFGEVNGPNSSVGIFSLILRVVGSVDVVVDVSRWLEVYLSL